MQHPSILGDWNIVQISQKNQDDLTVLITIIYKLLVAEDLQTIL